LAVGCGRARDKEPNGGQRRCLLRARSDVRCDYRAAEKDDELPPIHSIAASKLRRREQGISSRRLLHVAVRQMLRRNGCGHPRTATDQSPPLSPLA
jgi:hypothetical protein